MDAANLLAQKDQEGSVCIHIEIHLARMSCTSLFCESCMNSHQMTVSALGTLSSGKEGCLVSANSHLLHRRQSLSTVAWS